MQAPLEDTHPTNIISQWRDEWKSAPVVNYNNNLICIAPECQTSEVLEDRER